MNLFLPTILLVVPVVIIFVAIKLATRKIEVYENTNDTSEVKGGLPE